MGVIQSTPRNSGMSSAGEFEMTELPRGRTTGSEPQALPTPLSPAQEQARRDQQRSQSLSARNRLFGGGAISSTQAAPVEAASRTPAIVPIKMKSAQEALAMNIPGAGVSEVNIRMAHQVEKKRLAAEANGTPPPKALQPHNCFLLSESNGRYLASSSKGGPPELANGRYIFVTMLDGTTRLGKKGVGGNGAHPPLSSNSLYVRYAGEVEFAHGELQWFSNESGTYLPEGELHAQSGFDGSKFRPVGAKA